MKKYLLHPATFKLDGGAMFGIIPKPLWERKIKADEKNRINMSLRVVYIETENRKILIDTGIGDYHSDKFNHQFAIEGENLPINKLLNDNFQVKPEDITDIILTHLHFDHVGGLGGGDNGTDLLFPNANIHVHKKHYEYAHSPTPRDSGSFHTQYFMPLLKEYQNKGKLNLVDGDDGLILKDGSDSITFMISKGHTPYMLHPIFDQYIYMADLVPMHHHISIPWVMGYDIEPGTTTLYKEKFFEYIMKNNLTMIFEHDIETYGSKITSDPKKKFISKDSIQASKKIEELS